MTEAFADSQIKMAADIVSAYVSKNSIPPSDLPTLINSVHKALEAVSTGKRSGDAEPAPELKPAVPIRKSVTDDFLICLEDGKRFKSLRRHLSTTYGLTPEAYREKWGLAKDYPMVAPSYAAVRSNLAKAAGLGNKRSEPVVEPVKEVLKAKAPEAQPKRATRQPKAKDAKKSKVVEKTEQAA